MEDTEVPNDPPALPRWLTSPQIEHDISEKAVHKGGFRRRTCFCVCARLVRDRFRINAFCSDACRAKSWRLRGSVRDFEERHGSRGLLWWLNTQGEFLTGEQVLKPPIGHEVLFMHTPVEIRACRGARTVRRRGPENQVTWNEWKATHPPVAAKPKPKPSPSVECRFKPVWRPSPREYSSPPRGSFWAG